MHHSIRELFQLSPACRAAGGVRSRSCRRAVCVAALLALTAAGGPVAAQVAGKPDREQVLTFDAGQMRIDGKRKVRVLSGGVELRRGDFLLKAGEVEVRDLPQGVVAVALSSASQTASFRQKRDGLDESVEGQADRIEYDAGAGLVRLQGKAVLRRLRGSTVSEEVSGQTIVYDHERETFEVQGSGVGVPGGGRVKGVVTPLDAPRATGGSR